MDMESLNTLLRNVAQGKTSVEDAARSLMHLSFEDIDYAHIDHHRSLRKGFPEVIVLCLAFPRRYTIKTQKWSSGKSMKFPNKAKEPYLYFQPALRIFRSPKKRA